MASLLGQSVRNFVLTALLGCLVVLAPVVARAAPYAAYVIDARTGEVLYSKNADTRLHPASLTKMLTLYITFDAIRRGEISLDSYVTVTRHAASQPPSRLGLKAGQKIKLRYLIRAAAVKSANDAAAAIGDAIGGSEEGFAKRMDDTAKMLGMTNSTFKNANGLTRTGHLSTAHDMAILGRHLFYDFPQYYNIFSRRSTDTGMGTVYSTNRRFLDAYKGADGIKTGYTSASGFNLVASAQRGDKRIIGVIFGGTSTAQRNSEMAHLLDIGFSRAPAEAKVRRPNAPDLDMVAARDTPDAAPGKTVRLAAAPGSSPRPQPRPDAAPPAPPQKLLVAMKDDISTALDAVAQGKPAEAEQSQLADASAASASALAPTAGAALASSPLPAPRPDADAPDAGAAAVQLAAAAADSLATDSLAPAASPTPQPAPAAAAVIAMASPAAADVPGDTVETADAADSLIDAIEPTAAEAAEAPAPGSPPASRSDGIVFASATPARAPVPEARPEIVTRMSTSGGRDWGINVGRFPSRYQAEKALLRTALTESTSLRDSLRKVVQRKTGFDANFVGMTQDQADLACARLQARNIQCFSLSP